MFKHEEKLCPPAYEPSDAEIKLAKVRLIFEDEVFSIIDDLVQYYTWKETGEKPKYVSDEQVLLSAQQAMEEWRDTLDNWQNCEWWEAFDSQKHYDYIVDGLSSMHIGDCTAHPATCMRCFSEAMFKIPFTANWSKSEGHKMHREHNEDIKKHEDIQTGNMGI